MATEAVSPSSSPILSVLLYKRNFVDGEKVNGQVILKPVEVSKPVDLYVGLYGFETTRWIEKVREGLRSKTIEHAEEKLFTKQSKLLARNFHKWAFGKDFFDFSFVLPRNVPTSILVSTKNWYTAAIRYVLVATISPHDENNTTEEAL